MLNKILDAVHEVETHLCEVETHLRDAESRGLTRHLLTTNTLTTIKKHNEDLKRQIQELSLGYDASFNKLLMYMDILQDPAPEYNWNEAPVICELNGYRWLLGPEADKAMEWEEAVKWYQLRGGELPPRDVLLHAYLNEDIKPFFKEDRYWSSTEFFATYAWGQNFSNGGQNDYYNKTNFYVRAVKKVKI